MSLWQKLFSSVSNAIKGESGLSLWPIFGSGSWFGRQIVDHAKLMEQASNWVFGCVTRISRTIIAQPMHLYRKTGKSHDDWTEVEDHPLLDLLRKPNSLIPGSDLLEMWSQHEDLVGNAYWLLEGVKDEKSLPTGIIPLNPSYMTVVESKDTEGIVYKYSIPSKGTAIEYKPYQILHFRMANANSILIGKGPAEGAMDSIDTDNWMREWNRRFFQNGAIGSAVLETEDSNPEAIRLLRESFEDRHAGVSKAHKTMVLPKGIKLADKGYGQKDLDFVESRKQMRDEIMAVFGVPPIVLGMGLGESINRATAETQEYVFAKYTILPKLRHFETYINEFLLPRYGDDLVIEFENPVPDNFEQRIAMHQSALAGAAWMSINEVRMQEGLPPISGGDDVMGSMISTPVGRPTGKAVDKKTKRMLPAASKIAQKHNQAKDALVDKLVQSVKTGLEQARATKVASLTTEDWEARWKAFVARVEPEEKRMQETMADYAKGMTKRAIDALLTKLKRVTKAKKPPELLDRDNEIKAVVELMTPIYKDILLKEGTAAAEMVDAIFDEAEERMNKALNKSVDLMARKYTDETLAVLSDRLKDGLEAGDSLDQLTESVAEIGQWSETTRAARVARTEAFRTANFATKEAWKQSEVVQTIKWYTAEDERVCDSCSIMDGKEIDIDQNFADKGDVVGDIVVDYANVEAGSLHPNCRCYVRPEKIQI